MITEGHVLHHLAESALFELGIALTGGTAIRKLWAGNAGRFSTDIDFAGLDDGLGEHHEKQRVRQAIAGLGGAPNDGGA